eukprot:CAMPEP_0182846248 /NCGR_PEP_ID=MMETSP0006_2-20121128/27786_1 /TAXON_ID=97485 /ORGANISM="Prymnesium parvum, Strain Texoma1" /LENGTH=148 /DNA_ID=CAMNT_0024976427 /DNA_START=186 /DNA_END=632 /DNA_ORIENTATION=-
MAAKAQLQHGSIPTDAFHTLCDSYEPLAISTAQPAEEGGKPPPHSARPCARQKSFIRSSIASVTPNCGALRATLSAQPIPQDLRGDGAEGRRRREARHARALLREEQLAALLHPRLHQVGGGGEERGGRGGDHPREQRAEEGVVGAQL